MQKQLSPWREMWHERTTDRRVEHAQYVTLLPFVLSVVGFGIFVVFYLMSRGDAHSTATLTSVATTIGVTVAYGVAAWLIGKRRAAGGYLAIALFGWAIAASLVHQHISFNTLYSIVAIAVVMRAATELNLKWRLPTPR